MAAKRGMSVTKWRVRKSETHDPAWGIYPPGNRYTPVSRHTTHADAVEYLAIAQKWRSRGFN